MGFGLIEVVLAFGLLASAMFFVLQLPLGMERQAQLDADYQAAMRQATRTLERWTNSDFNELEKRGKSILEDTEVSPDGSTGGRKLKVTVRQSPAGTELVRLSVQVTWIRAGGQRSSLELVGLKARPDGSLHASYDIGPAAPEVR